MIHHTHTIRVRYAECDPMGFVHHSVYALYFEEARTEALRKLGIIYKELEDNGVIMPLRNLQVNFKKAAKYDDVLRIETMILSMPKVRCMFNYEIYNHENEFLGSGSTELFFVNKDTLRPRKMPEGIKAKFEIHFQDG